MCGESRAKTLANAADCVGARDSGLTAALLTVGWTLGQKSEMTNQYASQLAYEKPLGAPSHDRPRSLRRQTLARRPACAARAGAAWRHPCPAARGMDRDHR